MDPNACLERAMLAWIDGEFETCADALDDLGEWIGRGGFPPTGFTPESVRAFCAAFRAAALKCAGIWPAGGIDE